MPEQITNVDVDAGAIVNVLLALLPMMLLSPATQEGQVDRLVHVLNDAVTEFLE